MAFIKQLFDQDTSTFTYILADLDRQEGIIIDPVVEQTERDLATLQQLHPHLRLTHILETHVHADHITGANKLREKTRAKVALAKSAELSCADVQLQEGDTIDFGNEHIRILATPGHTHACLSFLWRDRIFTGDALLIGGCGRTDFQSGNAEQLYHSIQDKLFSLPDETLVYPGHDYRGRTVSSIAEERTNNPRLAGKSLEEFVAIMDNLALPQPKRIHMAVPANMQCGRDKAA